MLGFNIFYLLKLIDLDLLFSCDISQSFNPLTSFITSVFASVKTYIALKAPFFFGGGKQNYFRLDGTLTCKLVIFSLFI